MKKFLSLIISIVMIFALTIPAFAYEVGDKIPESYIKSAEDLINLLNVSENKTLTIKLAETIETNEKIYIPKNSSITIDCNGFDFIFDDLNVELDAKAVICNASGMESTINGNNIYNNGSLTIKDIKNDVNNIYNYGVASICSDRTPDGYCQITNGECSVTFIGGNLYIDILNNFRTSIMLVNADSIRTVDYDNNGIIIPLKINRNASIDVSELEKVQDALNSKKPVNLPLPTPTLVGAEFKGWCDKDGKEIDSLPTNSKTLIEASFIFRGGLTLDFNDGKTANQKVDIYDNGELVNALPEVDRQGYFFAGWTKDGKPLSDTIPLKPDDTIKATWAPIKGNEDRVTNALKSLGMGQTDINKILDILDINTLTGSVFASEPIWSVIIVALMLGCFAGGMAYDKKKKK